LSYRCFNGDQCAAIDPAKRVDCGYTLSQSQCEAAGCCYDKSVPFTFSCFCKTAPGPTPPGPAPPSPGPPPPPPPSPGPPAGSHYGDPNKGPCLPDEKAVQINGITGKFCSPSCSTSSPCPPVPAGTTATPQCVVQDPSPPPSQCAVICVPGASFLKVGDGGCMPGAACQAIQGTGVCTYADTNAQTYAFDLQLHINQPTNAQCGAPGPAPPSPGPPPPGPPTPGGHYGDPHAGPCQSDEKSTTIPATQGSFCAPACSAGMECPADVPTGTTAKPECVLDPDSNGDPTTCALVCTPAALDGGCPAKASCKAVQGSGACTYDN
jgi:hypothetical protein